MSEGPEVRIVADKIAAVLLSNDIKIENILHNKLGDEIKSKIVGSSVEYVKTFGKKYCHKIFIECLFKEPYDDVGQVENL